MSLSLSTCVKKLGQTTLPRIAPVALRTGFNASLNLNRRLYTTETEKPAAPAPEKPAEEKTTPPPPPPQEPPKTEQKRSYYEDYEAPKPRTNLRLAVCAGTLAALGGYYLYQDYKKKPKLVKVPSAEDALNKFISKEEASLFIKGKVFNRVDVDTVAHNNPVEDGFLAAEVEGGFLFGVADGKLFFIYYIMNKYKSIYFFLYFIVILNKKLIYNEALNDNNNNNNKSIFKTNFIKLFFFSI